MATIRKQKVGKYTYWQIVESRRVNGKPRPFLLAHLGTAEKLLRKLKQGPLKKKIKSYSYGSSYLLWRLAQEIGLLGMAERTFSGRERAGLSVGKSLALAAIHRAIKPGSKNAFADFAKETALPKIVGFEAAALTSQHFWDQMDTVTEEQIQQVEWELTVKMARQGLLDTELLFYDLTNFFTYLATDNGRAKLPKRGKNKQKRNDLRQFGLAQVVTKEFLIPVFTKVYEGNTPDVKRFVPFLTELRKWLEELSIKLEEVTLIFDKGSNSKRNFGALDRMETGYVASVSAGYHQDLLAVPWEEYHEAEAGGKKLKCHRTRKTIWGKERTVVLYLSEKLRAGQTAGLDQTIAKRLEALAEIAQSLESPRCKLKTPEAIAAKAKAALAGGHAGAIDFTVDGRDGGRYGLSYGVNGAAYRHLTEEVFGKKILVTCRDEWTETEIIEAYCGQSHVERVFKHLKNPYHHAVRPQYHWTDQKIRVHTFICVMGLLLSQLLWKKARDLGYSMSVEDLLDSLTTIRKAEIVTISDLGGKPQREEILEEMEPELAKLFSDLAQSVV
jgi:transposase